MKVINGKHGLQQSTSSLWYNPQDKSKLFTPSTRQVLTVLNALHKLSGCEHDHVWTYSGCQWLQSCISKTFKREQTIYIFSIIYHVSRPATANSEMMLKQEIFPASSIVSCKQTSHSNSEMMFSNKYFQYQVMYHVSRPATATVRWCLATNIFSIKYCIM